MTPLRATEGKSLNHNVLAEQHKDTLKAFDITQHTATRGRGKHTTVFTIIFLDFNVSYTSSKNTGVYFLAGHGKVASDFLISVVASPDMASLPIPVLNVPYVHMLSL